MMLAPAKINLDLRVLGRRADGYHELDSTVVFASYGDRLSLTDAPGNLTIDGPFRDELGPATDNLVLRAARGLSDRAGRSLDVGFRLTKRLPAAAGLGGGSSDAAATLSLLADHWDLSIDIGDLERAAVEVGADVPVCLHRRPSRMSGIGEKIAPLGQAHRAALAGRSVLLVNPRQPAPTGQVFAALAEQSQNSGNGFTADSRCQPNDLIGPALKVAPSIGPVLQSLSDCGAASAFGMSGSGPSCFALFERTADCRAAAGRLANDNPGWWVVATRLL